MFTSAKKKGLLPLVFLPRVSAKLTGDTRQLTLGIKIDGNKSRGVEGVEKSTWEQSMKKENT